MHTVQKDSERCRTIPVWQKMLAFLFSMLLVLSNATLYGRFGYFQSAIPIVLLLLSLLAIFTVLVGIGISLTDLKRGVTWFSCCVIVCAIVSLGTLRLPTMGHFAFLLLYAIFPLFILVCYRNSVLDKIFDYLSSIIAWLALSSSILWLFGPFLGVLKPNCTFPDTWSDGSLSSGEAFGYYGLLYQLQWSGFGSFFGFRNTSIFGEGPAFAFYLIIALLVELFYFKKYKLWRVFSFIAALVTSFSTTGWILALGIFVAYFYSKSTISKRARNLIVFIAFCLFCAAFSVSHVLFASKVDTSSGAIHMDDFKAGFAAWLSSPILGNGIGNNDAVVPFMSSSRDNNTGFSNTFLFVLATGGLLYFALWLASFWRYYRAKGNTRWFGLFFFLVVCFSNVSYFAFAAFFLSYGISLLFLSHDEPSHTPDNQSVGHVHKTVMRR